MGQQDQSRIDGGRRALLAGAAGLAAAGATLAATRAAAQEASAPAGRFADRVVLITGATSGIGEGTAMAIAREGAGVVFGSGNLQGNAPLGDIPTADFDDVWATNTRGTYLSTKHELPVLLANEPWGRFRLRGVVVNTASVSGHGGFPGIGPYSISKHGVIGLTRVAALDYGAQGVRINSMSPGGIEALTRRASVEAQGNDPDTSPAPNVEHRTNTVEEMADVVMFLSLPDARSSIMGTDIDVTMGMLTGPLTSANPPGGEARSVPSCLRDRPPSHAAGPGRERRAR